MQSFFWQCRRSNSTRRTRLVNKVTLFSDAWLLTLQWFSGLACALRPPISERNTPVSLTEPIICRVTHLPVLYKIVLKEEPDNKKIREFNLFLAKTRHECIAAYNFERMGARARNPISPMVRAQPFLVHAPISRVSERWNAPGAKSLSEARRAASRL